MPLDTSLAGYTVLVVDDEQDNLDIIRANFRKTHRLLLAQSAKRALELLATEDVACIVSDQRMPEMSGMELLRAARGVRPATVNVILTGYADLTLLAEALNQGLAYRYLSKPWNAEELGLAMRGAVERFHLVRENARLFDELVVIAKKEVRARFTLGQQVTRQVADLLLRGERGATGEKRELTVLFCDIRGFTSFAEARDPAQVVAFLNDFFSTMCEIVDRNRGTVNKFLGDGFLALFGAPEQHPEHASQAATAALQLGAALDRLRAEWELPDLDIRVGLHSGEVVVGMVGSRERAEYTAIGDAVNLASRIEGLNKDYGTRVLVSSDTSALLGPRWSTRPVGEAQVKGRGKTVLVEELLGPKETPSRQGNG